MKKFLLLSLVFLFKSFYLLAQCIPDTTTGLIAKWNFNGNANDLSGNGHNGTVVKAVPVETCRSFDSAYSFVGDSEYIDVPDEQALRLSQTDFTIAAWVYRYDTSENRNYALVSKRSGAGQKGYLLFLGGTIEGNNSGKIGFIVSGGSNDPKVFNDSRISLNSWQHIVLTYNLTTSTIKFYVNGVLNGIRTSMPSPNGATTAILRIGNDIFQNNVYGFNGSADDINMYSRELDSCDVASLYKNKSCLVLPISLLSFSGIMRNNSVILNWQTAQEINTDYFVIEKSFDGTNYTSIEQVKASGNSSVIRSYEVTDELPQNGNNYYRIKTVDKDGSTSYSKNVFIAISLKDIKLSIYPNPVKNNLNIKFYSDQQQKIHVQIIDGQGKIVQQNLLQAQAGMTLLNVNTSGLAKGVYHLTVNGQKNNSQTFIKE